MKSTVFHLWILLKLFFIAYVFNTLLFSIFRQQLVTYDDYFLPTFSVVIVMWVSNMAGYWKVYQQVPSTSYEEEIITSLSPLEIKEIIGNKYKVEKSSIQENLITLKISQGWNISQIITIDSSKSDLLLDTKVKLKSSTPFKMVDNGINFKGIKEIIKLTKQAEILD